MRQVRADASRNRELILDAAASVLARESDPSLTHIAEVAGVSRATIYRHFSDLSAIRAALMEEVTDVARTKLPEHLIALRDGKVTLPNSLVGMTRSALPVRTRYAKSMAQEPVPDAGLHASLTPVVEALVKQSQNRSEIRSDLDARTIAEVVISTGLYVARRVYRDGRPVEESVRVFEAMIRGLEVSPRPLDQPAY